MSRYKMKLSYKRSSILTESENKEAEEEVLEVSSESTVEEPGKDVAPEESLALDEKELDRQLKLHNEYINYLKQMIKQHQEALSRTDNEEVAAAIQRGLDSYIQDLNNALPDALKATPEQTTESLKEEVDSSMGDDDCKEDSKCEACNCSKDTDDLAVAAPIEVAAFEVDEWPEPVADINECGDASGLTNRADRLHEALNIK